MGAAGPVTALALDTERRVEVRVEPELAVTGGVTTEAATARAGGPATPSAVGDFYDSVAAQLGPGTGVPGHPPTAEEVVAGGRRS